MKHLSQPLAASRAGAQLRRRWVLAAGLVAGLAGAALLPGCGFALRSSQNFAFETVAVTPEQGPGVASELARYLGERVRPLAPGGGAAPDAVIDILQELREKTVVGVNASGQVREFQLSLRVRFRLRTPAGVQLIGPTDVLLQRSMSYSESAALAKEAEEVLLYRDMQLDAVQQLVRRLAAVKTLAP
jgi:LPS-assembly lipoprotein